MHDKLKLDISKAAFNFTHMAVDNAPVVFMELPVIKRFNIGFEYFFKLLFYHQGYMDIEINSAYAIATAELKATATGNLFPHLHDFKMDISQSKLYVDHTGKEFLYR